MGKNKHGEVTKTELQAQIDNITGENKVKIETAGKELEALFIESNRYYEIDTEGNVSDYKIAVQDTNPGDITKSETLTGDAYKPYKINCIEDLVDFSNRVNSGEDFANKYVELVRTLNFNSIFSYNDCKTKQYGDLNQNGTTEELKTELTTGIGFTPIGNETYAYNGNFEGNNFEIRNLYVETEGCAGLFGKLSANYGKRVDIQNLTITGNVKSTQNMARRIIWDYRYI